VVEVIVKVVDEVISKSEGATMVAVKVEDVTDAKAKGAVKGESDDGGEAVWGSPDLVDTNNSHRAGICS
jgi:hypothetical protein